MDRTIGCDGNYDKEIEKLKYQYEQDHHYTLEEVIKECSDKIEEYDKDLKEMILNNKRESPHHFDLYHYGYETYVKQQRLVQLRTWLESLQSSVERQQDPEKLKQQKFLFELWETDYEKLKR